MDEKRTQELEKFLYDAAGFIAWSIDNAEDFAGLVSNTLTHDIIGLVRRESCFSPHVSGYGKYWKG